MPKRSVHQLTILVTLQSLVRDPSLQDARVSALWECYGVEVHDGSMLGDLLSLWIAADYDLYGAAATRVLVEVLANAEHYGIGFDGAPIDEAIVQERLRLADVVESSPILRAIG